MRTITKDLTLTLDGHPMAFRLTKLDAFSGVALLRLYLRRADGAGETPLTLLSLIASFSDEELRAVMTAVLRHTEVLLPAGPHPVMTGGEWGYPELKHDTPTCMKLLLEGISWSLSDFFDGGGPTSRTAPPASPP